MWALYKEVQGYYDRGMGVPHDVTLLWSDDNWGNLRRLPTPAERKRSGGAGIYYHFDYVGGPRSYKWLNTNPITKVQEQMHLALAYGADRLWRLHILERASCECHACSKLDPDAAKGFTRHQCGRCDFCTHRWSIRISLGTIDSVSRGTKTLTIFDRGTTPVQYKIQTSAPWIVASPSSGTVGSTEQKVLLGVDWSKAPASSDPADATIAVTSEDEPPTIYRLR